MNEPFIIPPQSRVLVTGATGLTGRVLTRALVARGVHVCAIARTTSRLDGLADLPIEWVRGDVFDPETVQRAARDAGYVVHLASSHRSEAEDTERCRLVHVRSTELLLDAVRRQP